jgi:D-galactarolactone cycloisomerase
VTAQPDRHYTAVHEAGHVLVPEGPQLGIELDPDAVDRYRVC